MEKYSEIFFSGSFLSTAINRINHLVPQDCVLEVNHIGVLRPRVPRLANIEGIITLLWMAALFDLHFFHLLPLSIAQDELDRWLVHLYVSVSSQRVF